MHLWKMLQIDNHCLPTVWFIKDDIVLLRTLCLRSALTAYPTLNQSWYPMIYGPWWISHTWDWSKAKSLAVRTFISSESCFRWDLRSWESSRWRLLPSGPRLLANVFLAIWKTFWIGASPEIPPPLITSFQSILFYAVLCTMFFGQDCSSKTTVTIQRRTSQSLKVVYVNFF